MATRTYRSGHISIADMDNEQALAVLADMELFNHVVHVATNDPSVIRTSGRNKVTSDTGTDLRKKENAALRKAAAPSFHVQIKKKYGIDDYFATSVVSTAKAAVEAVKELNKLNIQEVKEQLSDLSRKLAGKRSRFSCLSGIKKQLIQASKSKKEGKNVSYTFGTLFERYDAVNGNFQILRGDKVYDTYPTAHSFECQYLDPAIRRVKSNIRNLEERKKRLEEKLKKMKAKFPGLCYGSKKLFRQQNDIEKYPVHDIWKASWKKARCHTMMISGRRDASQGNFLFSYNSETHELLYRSQQKDANGNRIIVCFPGVCFPYGQKNVDNALNAAKADRRSVAWRITRTGGSFLIQCMVDVTPEGRLNDCFDLGCVAMDSNYDNENVSVLDTNGNVLHHEIIWFHTEGCKSGEAEHLISKALDKVFELCDRYHLPAAMEDLKLKHVANRYDAKRKNYVTTRFAFSTITKLAEAKALKHSVKLVKVNPAYTSQIGKTKFAKKYGLSIHEAASAAIGRRAMGLKETLPEYFYKMLTYTNQNCNNKLHTFAPHHTCGVMS